MSIVWLVLKKARVVEEAIRRKIHDSLKIGEVQDTISND